MQFIKDLISGANKKLESASERRAKKLDKLEIKEGKADPNFNRKLLFIISGIIVAIVLGVLFKNSENKVGFSNYESERKTRFKSGQGISVFDTELKRRQGLEDLVETAETRKNYKATGTTGTTTRSEEPKTINPNKFECSELVNKVSRGEKLDEKQTLEIKACLSNNTLGLSGDKQKALDEIVNGSDLSDEARANLGKYINDQLDPNSDEYKAAKALASGDPDARETAKLFFDPNTSSEDKKKLSDMINQGKYDKQKIDGVKSKTDKTRGSSSESGFKLPWNNKKESASEKKGVGTVNIKETAEDLDKDKSELKVTSTQRKNAEDEVKRASAENDPNLGIAASNLAELVKKEEALKLTISEKEAVLKNYINEASVALKKANNAVYESNTSYEFSKDEIPEYIAPNVKKLTPDQLRILGLLNDNKKEIDESKNKRIATPAGGSGGNLVVYSAASNLDNLLNPSAPLKFINAEDIWLSDKNFSDSPVRFIIRQNAYALSDGRTVIPKGSMVFGKVSGLDFNTKTIKFAIDRAQVGNKIIAVKISATIRGEVLDTRGRELTAALLVDFVSSISDYYRKTAENEFDAIKAPSIMDAGTNAVSASLSSGMDKITQLLADDLKNASKIFFLPANARIMIYP